MAPAPPVGLRGVATRAGLGACALIASLWTTSVGSTSEVDRARHAAIMRQVVETIDTKAIGVDARRWPEQRQRAVTAGAGAADLLELYREINRLLADLDDQRRSFAMTEAQWNRSLEVSSDSAPRGSVPEPSRWVTTLPVLGNRQALMITVPAYISFDDTAVPQRARDLARQVFAATNPRTCGVVVDLQTTGGGSMWPAIVGLRAMLDPTKAGALVDRDGAVDASQLDARRRLNIDLGAGTHRPGELKDLPLAILIGDGTVGASEAIAAFLRNRDSAVLIGRPTRGATTITEVFELIDGGRLILATARLTDPDGRAIRGPIQPDVAASGNASASALKWLRDRKTCTG